MAALDSVPCGLLWPHVDTCHPNHRVLLGGGSETNVVGLPMELVGEMLAKKATP